MKYKHSGLIKIEADLASRVTALPWVETTRRKFVAGVRVGTSYRLVCFQKNRNAPVLVKVKPGGELGGKILLEVFPELLLHLFDDDVGLDVTGVDDKSRRRAPEDCILAILFTHPLKPILEGLPLEGDTSAHHYWINERRPSLQDRTTHCVGHGVLLSDIPVCHPVHGPHDL